MNTIKKTIKNLLPKSIRQPLLNAYHLLVAVAANVRYGFPARGAKVIMVTGTNGKTSTASLIAGMLENSSKSVGINTTAYYSYGGKTVQKKSSRTIEDMFDLHKMFSRMKKTGCEYIILEATSQALDQNRLWGVPCEMAIMTNLTQDHLDYHGTMGGYAAAKAKLFKRRPRFTILNRDDEWFGYFNRFPAAERKLSYGHNPEADAHIENVKLSASGSDIRLKIDDKTVAFRTRLAGNFNAYNSAAAAAAGYILGLAPEDIGEGIASVGAVPGRLERVEAGQPFDVIVDYAHTPDALDNVLGTMRQLAKGRVVAVFGATGDRDRGKRPLMGEIAARHADRIFVTDEETYTEDGATIRTAIIKGIKEAGGQSKTTEIADRRKAIAAAFKQAKKGDAVVITGLGHELTRNMGGKAIEWNDTEVAKELLGQLKSRAS
jgi:UDP-N-acetylmuramoyl-L-alanyl-D-glutamate--2,6-diaminopimelate ligase